jgi:hypothetical protein
MSNLSLQDTEEECRRLIDLVAHIGRREQLRFVEAICVRD